MPCYHPLHGYLIQGVGFRGQVSSYYDRLGTPYAPLTVPCGQCIGCRLERSRQWAIRCVHEASLHAHNCFITLTYDDHWLPFDRSLDVSVFQRFMKRLRKRFGNGIRFFHCGEYGDRYGRPHYHAIIFGLDFSDKKLYKVEKNGTRLYNSVSLDQLWADPDTGFKYGHAVIGDVTFNSVAYVARYVLKKITGDNADKHYQYIDPATGQVFQRKPEYCTMSRRPGIGKLWIDKYMFDVYPRDFVVLKGKKMRPPKFYDRQFEFYDPYGLEALKWSRELEQKKHIDDNTPDRLLVKETVTRSRLTQLVRGVDYDQ